MEKKVRNQRIIIVLLTVLLIYNFFALSNLYSRLDNINDSLNNSIQQVRLNVSTILSEIYSINEAKKQEASLITSFDFQYGELDESKMTVPVRVKIVPKAVSEDTALSLEFGGETVSMKKNGDSTEFTAEFERGLFEDKGDKPVRLVIKADGTFQTEDLEWNLGGLYWEFLPNSNASYVFDDITWSEEKGIIVDGTVVTFLDDEEPDNFKNAKLIYKVNGEVLAEDATNDDEHIQIYKTFPGYGAGDTLELYFEAEDRYGFIHETMLKRITLGTDGTFEEETEPDKGATVIKDKDGNVLCW